VVLCWLAMRRMLCWIPSRWSVPPGVSCLVVTVQAKSEPGHRHLITPIPAGSSTSSSPYPLALLLVVFARQLCRCLTILVRTLSESIYIQYLYSPSVMTDSDLCSSPFHSQHRPTSLQPLYTTYEPYIHNYIVLLPNHAVQNNPSCCIQYISHR
jgi:hypothetical protein